MFFFLFPQEWGLRGLKRIDEAACVAPNAEGDLPQLLTLVQEEE
jgi:hypothetical protein